MLITETFITKARHKSVPGGAPRELLHVMAAAADAGHPQGTIDDWTARMPEANRQQTTKALERLVSGGCAAKDWDATRYLWVYRVTL